MDFKTLRQQMVEVSKRVEAKQAVDSSRLLLQTWWRMTKNRRNYLSIQKSQKTVSDIIGLIDSLPSNEILLRDTSVLIISELKKKIEVIMKEKKAKKKTKRAKKKTKRAKKKDEDSSSGKEKGLSLSKLKELLREAKLNPRGKKSVLKERYETYRNNPESLSEEDRRPIGSRGRPKSVSAEE